jgi:hypothetical protein
MNNVGIVLERYRIGSVKNLYLGPGNVMEVLKFLQVLCDGHSLKHEPGLRMSRDAVV